MTDGDDDRMEQRQRVANELNEAILRSQGQHKGMRHRGGSLPARPNMAIGVLTNRATIINSE